MQCVGVGAGVVLSWTDCGKCGGEVVEGPCERCTRVFDWDSDEFHPSTILLEGRDEGGVLLDLLRVFLVASEVPGEPSLYEDEGSCHFVEVGLAGVGYVQDTSCVYEVRTCVFACFEEGLCVLFWQYTCGYTIGRRCALGVIV